MARRHKSIIYTEARHVDVEIELDDVIDQISDDELLAELTSRKLDEKARARLKASDPMDLLSEVEDWLRRGDVPEALLVLQRIMYPKFGSLELCEKEFQSRKAT